MRNLKKVLALVLALMMALSLMVTASAADYNDDADIDYDEAVAVMSAVGVFNGTSGGNFDPDGNLTRAQAAKIITYMLLSKDVADAMPNTGSKFTDCRDGEWYVGSVNYLTDLGIISGRSATTFDPKGNVTGIEFAKMLLGALGYKADKEGMEGTSSWATNIAILARGAGLDNAMTTAVLNSNALTRQQACQMAFNTMKATVVYYEDNWSVTTPDGTKVESPAERKNLANRTGKDYASRSNETTMQFCEMYFPTLKLNSSFTGTDDLGRTLATQWSVGTDAVYTGTRKLAAVFTATTSIKDVKDALAGVTMPVNSENGNVVPVSVDEVGSSNSWSIAAITDSIAEDDENNEKTGINEITAAGRQIEVYVDDDNVICQIISITYSLDTLKRVSTAANGNKTYVFENATGSFVNTADGTRTDVVLEGDVNVGDVVTTVQGTDSLHVYPTTTVSGKQTVFNNNNKVITVAGEKYAIGTTVANIAEATAVNFPNSATEATYYLDINGFVVKRVGPAAVEQFLYIADASGSVSTSINGKTVSVQVRAVLSDGTVGVYDLEIAQNSDSNDDYVCGNVTLADKDVQDTGALNNLILPAPESNAPANAGDNDITGQVYQYTTNSDGEIVLTALADGAADAAVAEDANHNLLYAIGAVGAGDIGASNKAYEGKTSHTTNGASVTALMSGKTVFVMMTGTGAKRTATVVTGTSGLSFSNDANGVVGTAVVAGTESESTVASAVAKVVFLTVNAPAAEIVDYVYIDGSKFVETMDEDGTKLKQYTGIASDGSEVTVYGPASGAKEIATDAKGLYAYDADNMTNADNKKADSATTSFGEGIYAYGQPVAEAGGALLALDSLHLNVTEETNVVYIDSSATGWDGASCYVVLKAVTSGDPTDVAAIFIVEAAAAADEDDDSGSKTAAGTIPASVSYGSGDELVMGKTGDNSGEVTATLEITLAETGADENAVTATVETANAGKVTVDKGTASGGKVTLTFKSASATAIAAVKVTVKVEATDTTNYEDVTKEITVKVGAQAS